MQATRRMKISEATSFNLSVIRILSAFGVMIGHNFGFCKLTVFCTQDVFPFIQNIGVVFLFILAGFFMAFSMDEKRGQNYRFSEFVMDRYIRLTVTLVPAIALVVVMDLIIKLNKPEVYSFTNAFNIKTLLGNLLFLQDIPDAVHAWVTSFASARPFWTLSVEWWIYLAVGYALLIMVPRIHAGGHITTWSVLLGAALSYPAACFLVGGRGNGLTLTFLLGMVIYVLHLRQKNTPIMINALGLVLSVVAMLITGMQTKEAYHLFFAGLCVLIVYFAAALGAGVSDIVFNRRCRFRRAVRFIASCTYPLYLVHYSVMTMLQLMWRDAMSAVTRFWLAIILSCIFAVALELLFERKSKKVALWIREKMKSAVNERS